MPHPPTSVARLSRDARIVLAGSAVSALGNGLTLPFLLIYLHKVRGIPLAQTGLLLAIPGVISLVAGPVAGALVDRLGARRVLAVGAVGNAVAYGSIALVHTAAQAVPVEILLGVFNATFYPSQSSLFARLAGGPALQRLFAMNFVLLNAGIGLGGLAAGLFVHVQHPGTFQLVYLLDAATFVIYAALVASIRESGRAAATSVRTGSYGDVLRHRLFRRVFAVSILLALTGYTQIDSGLPAFATDVAHVSTQTIALSFVANTAMIVIGQLVVLKRLAGVRRTRALLVVAGVWAASWAFLGLAGVLPGHGWRVAVVIAFGALFGLGETFMAPTVGPMINDIAPDHLRGRFNALSSLAYSVGFVLGPALSTLLIGAHLSAAWIGLLLAGTALVVRLSLRLEPRLTPAENGISGALAGPPQLEQMLI
ncbi:MAG TPA: MFS transporter [Mycobacteriales bacterium]|nr:MFS transporter [Mycobacteriales bacterium]